jgi:hypothetical protein
MFEFQEQRKSLHCNWNVTGDKRIPKGFISAEIPVTITHCQKIRLDFRPNLLPSLKLRGEKDVEIVRVFLDVQEHRATISSVQTEIRQKFRIKLHIYRLKLDKNSGSNDLKKNGIRPVK